MTKETNANFMDKIRYCYQCGENTKPEWVRFSKLSYGDGFLLDVDILFCSICGFVHNVDGAD